MTQQPWTNIRTWKTCRFRVELQWQHEEYPDISWADAETIQDLCTGNLTNVTYRVVVYWDGLEIGSDYLGNSVYANPDDFAREHFGINHKPYGCYLSDMLRTAISDARKTLANPPRLRHAA